MPRISQRYDLERMPDGHWRVVDLFTGQTAIAYDVPLDRLPLDDADDLVDLLNDQEREKLGRLRL